MKLIIEVISDKGSVRTINEDMILVGNDRLRNATKIYEFDFSTYEHPFLIAVADGLGGHKNGAVASEFVLAKMNDAANHLPQKLSRAIIKSYFTATTKSIHQCIQDEGEVDDAKKGMASTFSGVLFYGSKIFYLHVGDSRIYHFSNTGFRRVSRDHSLQELQGSNDTIKNAITNAFGGGKDIFIDFDEITNKLSDDDILLVCSDGLTNELEDETIASLLQLPDAYEQLVKAAKKQGGNDNISLAVIRYVKY